MLYHDDVCFLFGHQIGGGSDQWCLACFDSRLDDGQNGAESVSVCLSPPGSVERGSQVTVDRSVVQGSVVQGSVVEEGCSDGDRCLGDQRTDGLVQRRVSRRDGLVLSDGGHVEDLTRLDPVVARESVGRHVCGPRRRDQGGRSSDQATVVQVGAAEAGHQA